MGRDILRNNCASAGSLFKSWKELIKKEGQEAVSGFGVWMQPNASQDAILGHWHSELIAEVCRECGEEAAIHTVDCFMGELCESVEQHKYEVGQVTHVVGMKQMGKQQVTDLRFGRLAKVSLEPVLARQRFKKRRKAEHMDSAAVLLSNTSDMAEAMQTVH